MIDSGLIALVAALAAAPPAGGAPGVTHDPSCGRMELALHTNVLVYRLPHTFVRTGTDSVTVRGEPWVRDKDYALDALRGELRLLRQPIPGDTLAIQACWLLDPPTLEHEAMRYRPASGATTAAAADSLPAAPPRAAVSASRFGDPSGLSPGLSLQVAGSKTLAIEFGSNQDAFVRQSLDLTMSGTIAPGVELAGVLSDRNTPLNSAGATQDLQALDRVLLELKSPHGGAQLGDVTLSRSEGEFARIERRLQGVQANWQTGATRFGFAAANQPGQYRRMEFYGSEGFQGPYLLTDANGGSNISIVAGSEVVMLNGERLKRGEAADYSIDADQPHLTFTNRRPISSSSRITVEFQYSGDQYRRRLLGAGSRWDVGRAYAYGGFIGESDDRGRPLDATLGPVELATLAYAGDSARFAIVDGVSAAGGDYDTTRVDTNRVAYRWVGAGVGRFSVPFRLVGSGRGDYESFPTTSGTAYRFVGRGLGAYQVGRSLPLPENRAVWNGGAGGRLGLLTVDVEGAVSRLDRNTFSALDDDDNEGAAMRGRVSLERRPASGKGFGWGVAGVARNVERQFASFGSLTGSFEATRWGLAPGADVDHRREASVEAFAAAGVVGELRGTVGRLRTPDGYTADRGEARFRRAGRLNMDVGYARADGSSPQQFGAGTVDRFDAVVSQRWAWLVPSFRVESDEHTAPGDSVVRGARTRSAGVELATGERWAWFASAGVEERTDARLETTRTVDLGDTRVTSGTLRSPDQRALGGELRLQRRDRGPGDETGASRSDLGALRLRGDDRKRGFTSRLDVELTGDGQSRRDRIVSFVGTGQGAYDSLGNFVGTGDYTVSIASSPGFDRVSRAATSARVAWEHVGDNVWRGSRLAFDYETETRRRGDLEPWDPWVSPGVVLDDPALVRGNLVQRLESEAAPGSRIAALRLRVERRLTSDRPYQNFEQTVDDRQATVRWRTRPTSAITTDLEVRTRKQAAAQALAGSGGYTRTVIENGAQAQWVVTPDERLRVAAVCDASWARPSNVTTLTRTVRVGPELGVSVGARGHAELSVRRAFVSGADPVSLLPSSDPAGAPVWQGNGRVDYRLRESVTIGVFMSGEDRFGRRPVMTGRAEVRAFF